MPSILFVCTANRFRSPLAAAILSKALEEMGIAEGWRIGSAGTWATAGLPALQIVSSAADVLGLDLSGHRSARVSGDLLQEHDLILVMEASQKEALVSEFPELSERIYLLSNVVERRIYDIPDLRGSEKAVIETGLELNDLIRRGRDSICVLATYLYNVRHRSMQENG